MLPDPFPRAYWGLGHETICSHAPNLMTISDPQPGAVNFSVDMSDEDFVRFLKRKGLSDKDCDIIKSEDCTNWRSHKSWRNDYCLNVSGNGIAAKVFVTDISEEDINSADLGFTFGGKKVLKRLLKVAKYNVMQILCIASAMDLYPHL